MRMTVYGRCWICWWNDDDTMIRWWWRWWYTWVSAVMDSDDSVTSSVLNVTSETAGRNYSDVGGMELKRLKHGEIWTPEVTQRVATLVVLMVLTFTGNLAVVARLAARRFCCRRRHQGRSTTSATNPPSRVNVFIVNLAIGDLAVCFFTMTTEVLFVVFEKAWLLGAAACRLLLYVQVFLATSWLHYITWNLSGQCMSTAVTLQSEW